MRGTFKHSIDTQNYFDNWVYCIETMPVSRQIVKVPVF